MEQEAAPSEEARTTFPVTCLRATTVTHQFVIFFFRVDAVEMRFRVRSERCPHSVEQILYRVAARRSGRDEICQSGP